VLSITCLVGYSVNLFSYVLLRNIVEIVQMEFLIGFICFRVFLRTMSCRNIHMYCDGWTTYRFKINPSIYLLIATIYPQCGIHALLGKEWFQIFLVKLYCYSELKNPFPTRLYGSIFGVY
jgi:hypothetical protein